MMFGRMMATPILEVGREADLQIAITLLSRAAEQAEIVRWIEFPNSVLLFLLVTGDPDSGAVHILDRKTGTWYSVDFDDKQYGGYSVSQFDELLEDCHFLDLVERPGLWRTGFSWWVESGRKPATEKIFWVINLHQHSQTNVRQGIVLDDTGGAGREVCSLAETVKASTRIVNDYLALFVNRGAYTMQSMRPHPESGRHYYFRPTKKNSRAPLALTRETIRRHLEGEITVGLYAINPTTQRSKWVAIDADYKNALEDLLKLQYHLWRDGVEPALEMSKRGGPPVDSAGDADLGKRVSSIFSRPRWKAWAASEGLGIFGRHRGFSQA